MEKYAAANGTLAAGATTPSLDSPHAGQKYPSWVQLEDVEYHSTFLPKDSESF